jgi:phospholipid/cholesterol/gamma-HCH transport system ATP-binding protein
MNSVSKNSIVLENIFKSFRNGKDKILNGLNLKFPSGELTYILGPSGTGKSVTIKHILGLLKPDSGKLWVDGKDVTQLKGKALTNHRLRFGMLFQNSALFDDMTVMENVAFPLLEHTTMSHSDIRSKAEKTLTLLGMREGYDKLPNELSGGMKKRVGLARAIIREPSILLYDEPTTGLDPITRLTVDELIATLKKELSLTSLVISHDIPSALKNADHIAFLYQGNVEFFGSPKDFRKSKNEIIRRFLSAEEKTVEILKN